MQTEEGKRPHIITYGRRVLTTAESKYSVTHLEDLTVVWALQIFRDVFFGYPVSVYTYHITVTQLFLWVKPYRTSGLMIFHNSKV